MQKTFPLEKIQLPTPLIERYESLTISLPLLLPRARLLYPPPQFKSNLNSCVAS